jgi:hypothetical protein
MALPLALILLIGLGFVATGAVFMSNTEMRVSTSYTSGNNAIAVAEAAAEHGVARLNELAAAGEDPDSVLIVSDTLGSFTYTALALSKRIVDANDVDGDGDSTELVVALYNQRFGYAQAAATGAPDDEGAPVKLLIAEATDGRSSARVLVEVAKDKFKANVPDGPLTLNSSNTVLNGSFNVDGRLYKLDGKLVKTTDLDPPYGDDATSKEAAKEQCDYYKPGLKIPAPDSLSLSGSMVSMGHVSFDITGKKGKQNVDAEDSLSTFKFTPEEVLGVEPGALGAYQKSASDVPDFSNLSGINYITSGTVPSDSIAGSGILIVHNPNYDARKYDCVSFPTSCQIGYSLDPANKPAELKINGNGKFNGIIITDNLVRLNGNFSMLGGLVSLSTSPENIPANGSGWVRWSCEAVQNTVNNGTGYSIRLLWEHHLPEI